MLSVKVDLATYILHALCDLHAKHIIHRYMYIRSYTDKIKYVYTMQCLNDFTPELPFIVELAGADSAACRKDLKYHTYID